MKKNRKLVLSIILWGVLIPLVLFAAKVVFLSLRYSPEYMVREYFMDLGDTDDYLILPARKLTASPNPFQFAVDTSKEILVQETFQSDTKIKDLDTFLEDTGTWAFLVIQNDTILYERYFKGHQHDSLLTSFSVAKSFNSALIGIAIEEGYIKSVNDPITDYIPELAERDPRFRDIQIRHLLMMASGLRYEDHPLFRAPDHSLTYEFEDLRHLILTETEVVEQPGTTFVYNDYNPTMKNKKLILPIILILTMVACNLSNTGQVPASSYPTFVYTSTNIPATETFTPLPTHSFCHPINNLYAAANRDTHRNSLSHR